VGLVPGPEPSSDGSKSGEVESGWVVEGVSGGESYPADLTKLKDPLTALTKLKKIEARAKGVDRFAEFGLADPDDESVKEADRGKRITIETATGKVLADVILGRQALPAKGTSYGAYTVPGNPTTQFVRFPRDETVYMADQYVDVSPKPGDWTQKAIFSFKASDVIRVARQGLDENKRPQVVIMAERKPGSATWQAEGLEEGEKVNQERLSRAVDALADLKALEVVRRVEALPELLPFGFPANFVDANRVASRDGTDYFILFGGSDPGGGRYVMVGALFDKDLRVDSKPEMPDPSATKAAAERLNNRITGWVYVIPKDVASDIAFKRSDVIEKKAGE
jgi:hypothetical protein